MKKKSQNNSKTQERYLTFEYLKGQKKPQKKSQKIFI